jgi:hypothetical protein
MTDHVHEHINYTIKLRIFLEFFLIMKNTSPAVVFADVVVSKHRRLAAVIVLAGFQRRRCNTILHAGLPQACSCTMPLMARYLQTQLQKCR